MTTILPALTLDAASLTTETHEKYGESFTLVGNSVMMNGVLCKLYTFNRFVEEVTVTGKTVKVKEVCISFKPVKASEPKVISPTAELERQLAQLKKENEKLAKVAAKVADRTQVPAQVFDTAGRSVAKP